MVWVWGEQSSSIVEDAVVDGALKSRLARLRAAGSIVIVALSSACGTTTGPADAGNPDGVVRKSVHLAG
jgi:hypothetical protein